MNPLTNVRNINKLNERELKLGINNNCSWHKIYKGSPWIFIGGLDYDLTEGDIICVFSQYGEVEEINLVRDKKTGKSKGFCFLNYQNTNSTILAVDNLNGIKLCGRTIRVDHVADYRPPKEKKSDSDEDSTTAINSDQQSIKKEIKTEFKDRRSKVAGGESAEKTSKEKPPRKSKLPDSSKTAVIDRGKSHSYHHRTRTSSENHQESSSGHSRKNDSHFSKQSRAEQELHSSSDENRKVKHKLKKQKHKESKFYSEKRKQCDSSSDESTKGVNKTKHKRKKHKHKESRRKYSS